MSEPEFVLVSAEELARAQELPLPAALPVLPLKETVVLPGTMTPLAIGQERSLTLIDDIVRSDRLVALHCVCDPEVPTPGWDDIYPVGSGAFVHRMIRVPDGTVRVVVQGLRRVLATRHLQEAPYLVSEVEVVPDVVEANDLETLTRTAQELYARVVGFVPYLPPELHIAAATVTDPSTLCHLIASTLRLEAEQKQRLLELPDVEQRLRDVLLLLDHELEFVVD
ncbi:MAG TPA: LON peptidase substrate-binding domain-containing protein [Gaiellaceae bacterium]|nr:LON peptidase substrate-binding domain-containing protein [Gaiellaceae bacterium]